MPLQVTTLKTALFHLANLSVSRPRPEHGQASPGNWDVHCSSPDQTDPDARFGFFVDFEGASVTCRVDDLSCEQMAQVRAAYDHNVATLLPRAVA